MEVKENSFGPLKLILFCEKKIKIPLFLILKNDIESMILALFDKVTIIGYTKYNSFLE